VYVGRWLVRRMAVENGFLSLSIHGATSVGYVGRWLVRRGAVENESL